MKKKFQNIKLVPKITQRFPIHAFLLRDAVHTVYLRPCKHNPAVNHDVVKSADLAST